MPVFNTSLSANDILFTDGTRQSSAANPVLRNRVINGTMRVAQRGPVPIVLNTLTFGGCDRFPITATGFTTVSGTLRQATGTNLYVQEAQVVSTGSGTLTFHHRIEAINVVDIFTCYVYAQFEIYQDTGSPITITYNLTSPSVKDNWTTWGGWNGSSGNDNTTVIPSGVRTKVGREFAIDIDPIAKEAERGLGLAIYIPFGAVTNKYFQISNVQIEKGQYPTELEYIPLTVEQMRCQRYYDRITVSDRNYATGTSGVGGPVKWRQPMRVAPTATITAGTRTNAGTVVLNNITPYGANHFVPSLATGICGAQLDIIQLNAELL